MLIGGRAMNALSLHLALSLAWILLTGSASLANLILAGVLGFVALVIGRRVLGCDDYLRQAPRTLWFIVRLMWDLVASSVVVLIDVWTPTNKFKPRILRVPIKAATDLEITALANCITLTPGTTTLDVTPERDALIIHAMYAEDAQEVRKSITDDLEPRLLAAMRGTKGGSPKCGIFSSASPRPLSSARCSSQPIACCAGQPWQTASLPWTS